MHPKRSSQKDGSITKPVRSSDWLRRTPKLYGRSYYYYSPNMLHNRKRNIKTQLTASQIAKMMNIGNRPVRASNVTSPAYRTAPRREGLRPRCSRGIAIINRLRTEFGFNQDTSEEKDDHETENWNELDGHDADDGENEVEAEDEGDGEDEGEEDGDDDEEQDGRKRYDLRKRCRYDLINRSGYDLRKRSIYDLRNRSRYDLRNSSRYHLRTRSVVQRMPEEENNKQEQPRSPQRVLHLGMGIRVGRDVRRGGSWNIESSEASANLPNAAAEISKPFPELMEELKRQLENYDVGDLKSYKEELLELALGNANVAQTAHAIYKNHQATRRRDLGKFTIPIHIKGTAFEKVILDTGRCNSMMAKTVADELELGPYEPPRIAFTMLDGGELRSIGTARDIAVKIGEFTIETHFRIFDYLNDLSDVIVLGRDFLKTGGAIMDFSKDRVQFTVNGKVIKIYMKRATG